MLFFPVTGLLAGFADVAVPAVGVGGRTSAGCVKTVADVGFATGGPRRGVRETASRSFLGRFDSVRHEDGGVETEELLVVVEEERLSALDVVAYGDVEHDDSRMGLREFGPELTSNEFAVNAELLGSMRESEGNSARGEVPSRYPFAVRTNAPFRVRDSKADLCVSNASLSLFIN